MIKRRIEENLRNRQVDAPPIATFWTQFKMLLFGACVFVNQRIRFLHDFDDGLASGVTEAKPCPRSPLLQGPAVRLCLCSHLLFLLEQLRRWTSTRRPLAAAGCPRRYASFPRWLRWTASPYLEPVPRTLHVIGLHRGGPTVPHRVSAWGDKIAKLKSR